MSTRIQAPRELRPRATQRRGEAPSPALSPDDAPAAASAVAAQRMAAAPRVQALRTLQRRANEGPHAAWLARNPARTASGETAQLAPSDWLRTLGRGALGVLGAGAGWKAGAALGSWLGPWGTVAGGLIGGGLGLWGSDRVLPETEVASLERGVTTLRGQKVPTTGRQAWADQRLAALDGLEHRAYAWLNENVAAEGVDEFRTRAYQVLDDVQAMHVATIRVVNGSGLTLWTPDRDTLGDTERENLDGAWDELRRGTGLIRTDGLHDDSGTSQADDELRSMHARLLSRPAGRELLLTHLDRAGTARNKSVTIGFTPPDRRTPEQRAEVQELQKRLKIVATEITVLKEQGKEDTLEYETLFAQQMSLLGEIDDKGQGSDAAAANATNKKEASVFGGRGSDSLVKVREGTRDSDDKAKDVDGHVIPAPAWLQYGHELIHALHFRDGRDRTVEELDDYKATWTNKEEYQTIHGLDENDADELTENRLRAEHGITKRHGH